MDHGKPRPMRRRGDIGQVELPIEKLLAARAASSSCVHVEAALEADIGIGDLIKSPSHGAVMGKHTKD